MEEEDKINVKWAQEDVETSNNLLSNNNLTITPAQRELESHELTVTPVSRNSVTSQPLGQLNLQRRKKVTVLAATQHCPSSETAALSFKGRQLRQLSFC